jgi:hypothetical protein
VIDPTTYLTYIAGYRRPLNVGIPVDKTRRVQPKNLWSIRVLLEMSDAVRQLALFKSAIYSKPLAYDLVQAEGRRAVVRQINSRLRDVNQKKTLRPVQFNVTDRWKLALAACLNFV